MNNFNMNGAFGENTPNHSAPPPRRNIRRAYSSLRAEQWIDIVCCSIICLGVILTIIFWKSLTDDLFYNFLLPVINVGGTVLLIVAVLAIFGFIIGITIDSRRHRWFF